MSQERFPECPLKELPSYARMMNEILSSIDRLDDSITKVDWGLEIIRCHSEDTVYECKYRTGVFEKILGWINAIEDSEKRADAYRKLIESIFYETIHYDECLESLMEIADRSGIPGLREYVESQYRRHSVRHFSIYQVDLSGEPVDIDRINALLTLLAQLQFERQEGGTPSDDDREEEGSASIKEVTDELNDILVAIVRDGRLDRRKMDELIRVLIKSFINLDLFDVAIDWLDRPDMNIEEPYLTYDLFRAMQKKRGDEETQTVFLNMFERFRLNGITVEKHKDWIMLAHIANMIGLENIGRRIIHHLHTLASNETDDKLPVEQRCKILRNLGDYYVSPFVIRADLSPKPADAYKMLNEALHVSESIEDIRLRREQIIRTARSFGDADFHADSLDIFRKYLCDHDFVVGFYEELIYPIMDYYRRMDDDDKRKWGREQRKSWLLFNLHHLRQSQSDVSKYIESLIHFCFDLKEYYEDC